MAGLTIRQSYEVCEAWVVRGLRQLGVDAHHVPINDIACSEGKIGGAAQARRKGVVLHHTTIAYDMDIRPGGAFRFCMRSPQGTDYWKRGVYREIVEPERLVFTFAWEDAQGALGHETLVTVTFAAEGTQTRSIRFNRSAAPAGSRSVSNIVRAMLKRALGRGCWSPSRVWNTPSSAAPSPIRCASGSPRPATGRSGRGRRGWASTMKNCLEIRAEALVPPTALT